MIEITPQYLASQGLSESFPARFWAKVHKTDGCWLWTAPVTGEGYGRIWSGSGKIHFLAHVGSWMLHFGPVPPYRPCGIHVLHKCDVRHCVNPVHLWLGTDMDNCRDRDTKGRGVWHKGESSHSAKLTEAEVLEIIRLHAQGRTQVELGPIFGVTKHAIWRIVHGRNWKYLNTQDPGMVPNP